MQLSFTAKGGSQKETARQRAEYPTDQVKVGVADDGSLALKGTVATDRERQQIEDVARSAAPNHTIGNNLKVSGSVSSSGMSSRGSGLPQADQQQGVEKPKTRQNITRQTVGMKIGLRTDL
ncbi:MAG TPA: hypothetical protein VJT08_12110 [Terriglobales bacterium]|nr:hypothetical protein [Terriglobales bacterium]